MNCFRYSTYRHYSRDGHSHECRARLSICMPTIHDFVIVVVNCDRTTWTVFGRERFHHSARSQIWRLRVHRLKYTGKYVSFSFQMFLRTTFNIVYRNRNEIRCNSIQGLQKFGDGSISPTIAIFTNAYILDDAIHISRFSTKLCDGCVKCRSAAYRMSWSSWSRFYCALIYTIFSIHIQNKAAIKASNRSISKNSALTNPSNLKTASRSTVCRPTSTYSKFKSINVFQNKVQRCNRNDRLFSMKLHRNDVGALDEY